jgi:hypothetical protein
MAWTTKMVMDALHNTCNTTKNKMMNSQTLNFKDDHDDWVVAWAMTMDYYLGIMVMDSL